MSQNSIRFHHKDHERHIYSPYCSVSYWSGSLGKEFSGGGTADAGIFVSTSWASHSLIILFYPRWLKIRPKSYEKNCLTSMWKLSRKILTMLDVLHTAVPKLYPLVKNSWTWWNSVGKQQIPSQQSPREQLVISVGLHVSSSLFVRCWTFWWKKQWARSLNKSSFNPFHM